MDLLYSLINHLRRQYRMKRWVFNLAIVGVVLVNSGSCCAAETSEEVSEISQMIEKEYPQIDVECLAFKNAYKEFDPYVNQYLREQEKEQLDQETNRLFGYLANLKMDLLNLSLNWKWQSDSENMNDWERYLERKGKLEIILECWKKVCLSCQKIILSRSTSKRDTYCLMNQTLFRRLKAVKGIVPENVLPYLKRIQMYNRLEKSEILNKLCPAQEVHPHH